MSTVLVILGGGISPTNIVCPYYDFGSQWASLWTVGLNSMGFNPTQSSVLVMCLFSSLLNYSINYTNNNMKLNSL